MSQTLSKLVMRPVGNPEIAIVQFGVKRFFFLFVLFLILSLLVSYSILGCKGLNVSAKCTYFRQRLLSLILILTFQGTFEFPIGLQYKFNC